MKVSSPIISSWPAYTKRIMIQLGQSVELVGDPYPQWGTVTTGKDQLVRAFNKTKTAHTMTVGMPIPFSSIVMIE